MLTSCAFLRDYWYSTNQKLRARNDNLISRFHAVEHDIIVADDLADLERLLMDHIPTLLIGLGDKSKIEPADSRHGHHRNHRFLLASPNHARANDRRGAQTIVRVCDPLLCHH